MTLTSWSAGYGSVRAILAQPGAAERVSAVILLDSLHASYVVEGDPSAPRVKDPAVKVADLDVFTRLAADAAAGRKRFWVTHSEVYPGFLVLTEHAPQVVLREAQRINLTSRVERA